MPGRRYARETVEFDRGLAFFDAIYAVAITLLIVDVEAPTAADWQSLATLAASPVMQQLLAFTISFLVIANFWRVNHRIMADVQAMDGTLLNVNILAVFFIVVLPFSTSAITESGVDDLPLPVAMYALNIILASLAQQAIWLIARRRGVAVPTSATDHSMALGVPLVFAVSIPIAFLVGPDTARNTWLLLLLVGPLAGVLTRRRARTDPPADPPDPTADPTTQDAPPG